jgi:hypothetical protein
MLKTPDPKSVMIAITKARTIALETVILIIDIFFMFISFFMIDI